MKIMKFCMVVSQHSLCIAWQVFSLEFSPDITCSWDLMNIN